MEMTNGRTLIERYIDTINQRHWDDFDELFAPEYRYHGASIGAGEHTPPEAVKRYFHYLINAFPDLHIRADLMIVTDEYVVLRWAANGTHQGEYMGLPATGRHGEQAGISIWRLAQGRFVEGWQNQDDLGLVQSATAPR